MKVRFIALCSAALLIALSGLSATAAPPQDGQAAADKPAILESVKNDESLPLAEMSPAGTSPKSGTRIDPTIQNNELIDPAPSPEGGMPQADGALRQTIAGPAMPSTLFNFDGVGNVDNVLPPDTEGDVGRNHYLQMVNLSFAVYDKTGTLVYGPAKNNVIWRGFGGQCEVLNSGDPIVQYDPLADRWMVTQFAINSTYSDYHQCIAVSKTSDPTGKWYRYDFVPSGLKMNDYTKIGVWTDGYYAAYNQFDSSGYAGQGVAVFERDKMLRGLPAKMVSFDLASENSAYFGMLPSDLDGTTPPPANSPNYFVEMADDSRGWPSDALHIFKFAVDWTTPENSTFTGPTVLATAAFDSNLCAYSRDCIPQPGTSEKLDAISDRLMYRLAYRNLDGIERLVVNHTVDATGSDDAGIRWYEIHDPGGSPTIYQQNTYAPGDGKHRWMGSAAMDKQGNIAMGYSFGNSTTFPSIGYVGRLASDPLSTLGYSEGTIMAGSGYQSHSASRWGDYSSISLDPIDDCTFWYTTEYYAVSSSSNWKSRIAAFKFPGCTSDNGTISGTITSGGSGLPGVTVVADGGGTTFSDSTDSSGNYTITAPAGSYSLRTYKNSYPEALDTAEVASGSNVTVDVEVGANTLPPFLDETFDVAALPTGWSTTDAAGSGKVWKFNNPASRTNLTGGSGGFAIADSDSAGSFNMDTSLVTPSLNLTSSPTACLRFDTDFYRYQSEKADVDVSVDGGSVWTNVWRKTLLSHRGPRSEFLNISSIAGGQSNVKVRFRYYDANYEWWWQVDNVKVTACDITSPTNPLITSTTHLVGDWSTGSEIDINLLGPADDLSGVAGYSFNFSPAAPSTPDEELDHQAWERRVTSPDLSDGTWYFNLRTVDNDGNWSSTTSSLFKVDSAAPDSVHPLTPADSAWTTSNPTFTWAPTADELSGLDEFQLWVNGVLSVPGLAADDLSATPDAVLPGGANTWMIRAIDSAGNYRDSEERTVSVDASAPTGSVTFFSSPPWRKTLTFPVAWSGADPESGIAKYTVRKKTAAYNANYGAYSTWKSGAGTSANFTGTSGSNYCFDVAITDNVGNVSAYGADQCIAIPLNNTGFTHSTGWTKSTGSGYFLSTFSKSSKLGASLTKSGVKAKYLALVATKCKGCGKVKVYMGSTLLKTIDLSATSTKKGQVIPIKQWSSVTTGKVTIKVATSSKPVIIEGLGISKF